jgi:type II secretory pathway pseudopilin PulG
MKKALTMGELLVTMAIIGVIAILVLPGLIKDYQKKLFSTKLKKSVELIDNAVNQACIDNGVSYFYQTPYSVSNDATSWNKFLKKYFKAASYNTSNPFADSYMVLNTQASSALTFSISDRGFMKLADGGAVSFMCVSRKACVFVIDLNSTDKPNVGGRDLFTIFLDTQTNLIYDSRTSESCGSDVYGYGCYAKIIENNWEMTY